MDLSIRVATEEDIPAILELFEIALRSAGGPPIEAFWQWKHICNPFGPSPVLLAFAGDRLVGLRAFMRWQWKYQGEVIPAFRAVDTATHPEFQGKGIFSKLTYKLIDELKATEPSCFIYNTPNNKSKPGYLKMKWEVLGKPNVLASLSFTYPRDVPSRFSFFEKSLQDLDFSTLTYTSNNDPNFISTNHSIDYFRWRYQSIPKIPYGSFLYETGDAAVLLFFHIKKRGYLYELRICDELWLKGQKNNTVKLRAYQKVAGKLGTTFVTFLPDEPISTWGKFRFRIFGLKKYAPDITIREVNDGVLLNKVKDIHNWSFNLGDLELF